VIFMPGKEHRKGGRRLRKPVNLALQRHNLISRLPQRRREALIIGGSGPGVRPSISQPPLKHRNVMRMR
jgi:hypothetical protein